MFDKNIARTAVKWMIWAAVALCLMLVLAITVPAFGLTFFIVLGILKVFLLFYAIAWIVQFVRSRL